MTRHRRYTIHRRSNWGLAFAAVTTLVLLTPSAAHAQSESRPTATRSHLAPSASSALNATNGWSIVASPNGKVRFGSLTSVSCPDPDACEAVGYFANGTGDQVPLVEVWNGTKWTRQTTPNPPGGTYESLNSVSCVTKDDCEAVGSYDSINSGTLALAEEWNGSTWSIQTTPTSVAAPTLASVSCIASDNCEAVGSYYGGSGDDTQETLAELWNGSAWTVQTTAGTGGLDGISCTASDDCEAVGSPSDGGSGVTLAENWNGTTWTLQTTPVPSKSTGDTLNGVSCTTSDECVAVGIYESRSDDYLTLAEGWNGTTWTLQTTGNPSGASDSLLRGVSCSAPDDCEAVGLTDSGPLSEIWNGSNWSIQTINGFAFAQLADVSCTAAAACEAVGNNSGSSDASEVTFAEVWNGTTWTMQASPSPSGTLGNSLNGVSCVASDECEAVGYTLNDGYTNETLAEGWNGTKWTLQTIPDPTGASQTTLEGISCTASDDCEAVGYYTSSSGAFATLAEEWNGSTWSTQTTRNPTTASELTAISCVNEDDCEAVGFDQNNSGVQSILAEVWNGTAWTKQTAPGPSGSLLDGISCVSASDCEGVGNYPNATYGTGMNLAEQWNGKTWITQTAATNGTLGSSLGGVSCTASNACEAVGSYVNPDSGNYVTLAEGWNGTNWTIQTTPSGYAYAGVSCGAENNCDAVGPSSGTFDGQTTLAATWNGTKWKTQATPNPTGAKGSGLGSISCPVLQSCKAVGSYEDSSSTSLTLAEQYTG